MARAALLAFLGFCLQVCGANNPNCSVSSKGDQVIYKVSPPIEYATLKEFSWAWANTASVLATKADPAGSKLVKESTANILITSKCYDDIILTKHYILKDRSLQDFIANCSTSCEAVMSRQSPDGQSKIWIGAGVGVLLLIGLIFLGYKFRDKICSSRTRCCSQTECFFTSVKVIHEVPCEAPREEILLAPLPVAGEP